MINPFQTQAELSAAYIRATGFAWANQLKILQLMTDTMIQAPFAPVRALHKAAAQPSKPKAAKTPVKRKATVGDAGKIVVKAPQRAKKDTVAAIEPTQATKPVKTKSAPKAKPKVATKAAAEPSTQAKTAGEQPKAAAKKPAKATKAAAPKAKAKPAATAQPKVEETPKPARRKTRAPSKPPAMPSPVSES